MQAVNTVVAGILHDVIDDTIENISSIENEFGEDVARLVAGVSKLSYINQVNVESSFFDSSIYGVNTCVSNACKHIQ